jgi:hypothetical protein
VMHRSLGILGGALLVGGVVLGIATGIAAGQVAQRTTPAAGIHRPDIGAFPRQRVPGQPGPFFGGQGRRSFPGPGSRPGSAPTPSPKASP